LRFLNAVAIDKRPVAEAVRGASPNDPRERPIEPQVIRHVSDCPVAFNNAAAAHPPRVLDPGAELRAAVERITIRRTTLEIELLEGMAEDSWDCRQARFAFPQIGGR
jgi:hypothetical protein